MKDPHAELLRKSPEALAYTTLRLLRPLLLGLRRTLESHEGGRGGISVPMRDVMDLIRQAPDRSTVPFLARVMMLDRQPVQRAVNKLLRAKLLARVPNPAHQRSALLKLTALGATKLDGIQAAEMRELRSMVSPFSKQELVDCVSVLEHLRIEFAIRTAASEVKASRGRK
jgi:DNA-binding MarR family transcriptional regulator